MNLDELNIIYEKIRLDGLEIKESDFLNEIFKSSNFKLYDGKLINLIKDIRLKDKPKYAFALYIGFLNTPIEIENLPDIAKLKSYSYLKGSLNQYFKGHLNINYKYSTVSPYHNYYSFIVEWWPYPFSIPRPIILLLNWIYEYDKSYFFKLIFSEKQNYLFISLFKGKIIRDLKLKEEYIDFKCDDELKFYTLFNYLTEPFIDNGNGRFSKDIEMWKFNYEILQKIELNLLVKIILDYIKSPETTEILIDVANILKDNFDIFYKTFEELNIKNIRELSKLFDILYKLEVIPRNDLLNICLNKLKTKFMEKYITVNLDDWKIFLGLLTIPEINEVKNLIDNMKTGLIYISELDKQIRHEKYLIDIKKSEKFYELLIACEEYVQ